MRFEKAQVLDLLRITKEALRHWKTVLSPIGGRDGRSGGYTFGEVLALALIAEASTELDVPVSRFKDVAHRFFAEIAPVASQPDAADVVVSITRGDVGVHRLSELPPATALALVRIDPVLQRLRRRLSGAARELDAEQMAFDLIVTPRVEAPAAQAPRASDSTAPAMTSAVNATAGRDKRVRRQSKRKRDTAIDAKPKNAARSRGGAKPRGALKKGSLGK